MRKKVCKYNHAKKNIKGEENRIEKIEQMRSLRGSRLKRLKTLMGYLYIMEETTDYHYKEFLDVELRSQCQS